MSAAQGCQWVVLLLCLIGKTAEHELQKSDWEELGQDVASLHKLRRLSHRFTYHSVNQSDEDLTQSDDHVMKTVLTQLKGWQNDAKCILQRMQDINLFLKDIERKKNHDALLTASEVSYSYRNKVIVSMDNSAETLQKAEREYSEDPDYSIKVNMTCLETHACPLEVDSSTVIKIIGSSSEDGDTLSGRSGSSLATLMLTPVLQNAALFSISGNISSTFSNNFMRVFKLNDISAVLETTIEKHHVYQIIDEHYTVVKYQSPKKPVDHRTQYDHQAILIMEDDPVVRKAATYLYDKHPTVTSVYMLENGRPKLIKGDAIPLSEDSRLQLVGHGKRDQEGNMRLGGYKAEEVAEIIKHMNIEHNHIKTTSVVGCEVGSDKAFYSTLLKELRVRSIQTELHLKNSLVNVSPTGQKLTAEITLEELVWRQKDDSKKIVAKLNRNNEVITQIQSEHRGKEMFSKEIKFLGSKEEKRPKWSDFRDKWPNSPQTFVQNGARTAHTSELEALSWAVFGDFKGKPISDLKLKYTMDSKADTEFCILDPNKLKEIRDKIFKEKDKKKEIRDKIVQAFEEDIHLKDNNAISNILEKCHELKSGKDFLTLIHQNAKYGHNSDTYVMLHDWIFQVDHKTLYVYPVGKRIKKGSDTDLIQKHLKDQLGKETYFEIRDNIKDRKGYVEFCKNTLEGNYSPMSLERQKELWFSIYFLASGMSESARNFRNLFVFLMAVDLAQNKDNNDNNNSDKIDKSDNNNRDNIDNSDNNVKRENNKSENKDSDNYGLKFLFEEHPMAHKGSWVSPNYRGFQGTASSDGSSKKTNKYELNSEVKKTCKGEEKIVKKWIESKSAQNQNKPLGDLIFDGNLLKPFNLDNNLKDKYTNALNEIKIKKASGALGGSYDGPITLHDPHRADVENSFKLSAFKSRALSVLSEHIQSELKRTFGEDLQQMHVKPESVMIKDGEFHCQLVSEKNPQEVKEWRVQIPEESRFYIEKIQKNIERFSDPTTTKFTSDHFEHASTALGTVGLLMGLQGAVHAFERGDIEHGTVGALQTVHGVTGMTLAALGKYASVSESTVAKAVSRFLKNPATKRGLKVLPVVGIGFGIYNVVDDIRRGDTLGYTDAGFDMLIVEMDILELVAPELAPVNLALNAIRMVFDDVYLDVQAELNKLPPNAGILNKIGAFFLGVGEGFYHFALDVDSFFVTIPYREIEKGQKLVEQVSDYHLYYTTTEVQAGRQAIDFAGGASSWNGGSITFCLSDQGSSQFCMDYFISADESIRSRCWSIDTNGADDIVLGTGQSNTLSYSNIEIKLFMFIPVGSIQVVSGYQALEYSRYGTYSGNNKGNTFYAVQKNTDSHAMEIMLSYYYMLYGKAGDDTFFLGPQRSYIEGQDGKDIYIIPKNGGYTIIQNYDPLKTTDLLKLDCNFCDISATKEGNGIVLQYLNDHYVRISNWFIGQAYRHINMISGDGILFDISTSVILSVKLLARGVYLMSEKKGQSLDTTEPLLVNVTTITGSPYNDNLIGNAQKNVIDGGGGWDYMKGGEGEDIYIVNERENSKAQIENYSKDKKTDMILIEANLHDFRTKVENNNLILIPFNDYRSEVTLINWFRSEEDRHLLVVTKDLITFSLSVDKSLCTEPDPLHSRCIQSHVIDYTNSTVPLLVDLETDEAYQNVTEVRGSNFNDNIKGNAQTNNIISGRGTDFLQGRGGKDWYIVTPGHGLKIIDNSSPDLALDTLFIKERYELITVRCRGTDLKLFLNNAEEVLLKGWFTSNSSQHLQVRTADGITFNLISDSSKCDDQLKLPQSVDYRNDESAKIMRMNEGEFVSVVEMYGSSSFDHMIGNDKDNLLDPFKGGGIMTGGEGKDTYVVKPEYGTRIIINNFANDGQEDTVQFQTEFLHNPLTVEVENNDVIISAFEKGVPMKIRLWYYKTSPKHRHLSFQTIDGVYFRVEYPVTNQSEVLQDPSVVAYRVQLQGKELDCYLDLSSQRNLSTVHTVKGCSYKINHIMGNGLDNALFGGTKADIIDGGDGDDTLIGGAGNDVLLGSSGNDTLYGEDGDDTMLGGPGFDIFVPGPGADVIDGGPGRDTVLYQGDHQKGKGVYINLLSGEGHHADAQGDVLKDVENVIGTIYSDILISGYEPALLKGSDGDDVLVSVNDGDYLVGGNGRDIYMMVSHHDLISVDNCADDNATDILYLPCMTELSVDCMNSRSELELKLKNDNGQFVTVLLKDWLRDPDRCGHLTLITGEGIVPAGKLKSWLQDDAFKYMPYRFFDYYYSKHSWRFRAQRRTFFRRPNMSIWRNSGPFRRQFKCLNVDN